MEKVNGKNYTSNTERLTKHLDKLSNIQSGAPTSPVMIHMSLTNTCNLHCDYCCYGQRDLKQVMPLDDAYSALEQFAALGTKGVEFTGGGDPTMYKDLGSVLTKAHNLGYDIGLITNGIKSDVLNSHYAKIQWMRVSLHGLNFDNSFEEKMGNTVRNARKENPNIDISSVYIWTKGSEETIKKVAAFTNKYEIPTRVTPDLTLGKSSIDDMMGHVGDVIKSTKGNYLFLSDFNVKTTREHDNCYMHLIKPFVFTDGNVYDCPSLALSPDNHLNVNEKFKVTDIKGITDFYTQGSKARLLDCEFCKYAPQNELIDSLKKDIKHKNFA